MKNVIVPAQKKGASFDVRAEVQMKDREEAVYHYSNCREKLLHISLWGVYLGETPETFILTDPAGNEQHRAAQMGDCVKIHLPGPRSLHGDGADWVRVEQITEDRNKMLDEILTAITLRPCANPCLKSGETAHFFDERSTNTLIVCRHKTVVTSSIHGRNELMNTETDWLEYLRNLAVALPAKAGLSNPHWKKLAKALIC